AGVTILSAAKKIKAKKVVACLLGSQFSKKFSDADCAQALTEGVILSSYKFTKYLKADPNSVQSISFHLASKKGTKQIQQGVTLAENLSRGVFLARDMVNLPANELTPLEMSNIAKKIKGVTTRVHNLAAIKKMKMGAYLSVAQGSAANPPYFIEMHYKPKGKAKKKIALVGKGVTFDTGGYSLKPPKSMETMKDDMAGAAAVVSVMSIIADIKPNVEVSAYVAATENMVDGHAQRPGDVCKALNGKTIEVLNTDAEGRLTLADALTYAIKKKPDYVIDMATLTGACLVALGLRCTGIMGNDQTLINKIQSAGEYTGERLWQLPLIEEYGEELKSTVADLKNIGSPYAGTITAGLFLQHFVGDAK
ncbi:hypothetical protein BVY03_04755, partial [bacterium K02(2017)]